MSVMKAFGSLRLLGYGLAKRCLRAFVHIFATCPLSDELPSGIEPCCRLWPPAFATHQHSKLRAVLIDKSLRAFVHSPLRVARFCITSNLCDCGRLSDELPS